MRTLIAIIENSEGSKTSFGTNLSGITKIPKFELSTYTAKYGAQFTESQIWALLLNSIGLKPTVIFDNTNAENALRLSKYFERKVVFLERGENNSLTSDCLRMLSNGGYWTIKANDKYPEAIINKAEIIRQMNPSITLLNDLPDRDNHMIWRIQNFMQYGYKYIIPPTGGNYSKKKTVSKTKKTNPNQK